MSKEPTTFGELKIYDKFTLEEEPQSVFSKHENRYDGAINAYQKKSKYKDEMFKPVTFSKGYGVILLNREVESK
ncbi:hypothetical protein D3C73_387930 [compost metagenome]